MINANAVTRHNAIGIPYNEQMRIFVNLIDQINELPEDGLKSSPETLRYIEYMDYSKN